MPPKKKSCAHAAVRCALCLREARRKAVQKHREEHRERVRARERAAYNTEKNTAAGKAYRKRHPDRLRLQQRRNAGIKDAHRCDSLLAKQKGTCAICGAETPGGHGTWHADHDHKTGLLRGMLCTRCNVGLGYMRDSVDVLQKAIAYLQNPPAQLDAKHSAE